MFLILETLARVSKVLLVSCAVWKASRGGLVPCHAGGMCMHPLDAHWSAARGLADCSSSMFTCCSSILGWDSWSQAPLAFPGTILLFSLPSGLPPLGGVGCCCGFTRLLRGVPWDSNSDSSPARLMYGERAELWVIFMLPAAALALNQWDGCPFWYGWCFPKYQCLLPLDLLAAVLSKEH